MVIYKGRKETSRTDMEKNYTCLNLPCFIHLTLELRKLRIKTTYFM